ncbi:glycosylhydrolase-like jelly roll fold domain-containing protein [Niabella hibiscisoli]|uniref:glycosylhydrolase-like jelly roll fold domain-containing protein n=1 Tax=Niabella hibiscisoli TaxID=1825928 RepID=UPI001F0F8727|nr:glycosylhydrolase-like jelly roll fold domain-containing protein [Niabella hibiscisoli]MCH5719616.1 hypothetical protein [Niabella hibiscisoli]
MGLKEKDAALQKSWNQLFVESDKGRVIEAPYTKETFEDLGVTRDIDATGSNQPIAWTHRKLEGADLYFISNQQNKSVSIPVSFRITGFAPEIWDPASGTIKKMENWHIKEGRTYIDLNLHENASMFLVFRERTSDLSIITTRDTPRRPNVPLKLNSNWEVKFDPAFGGPEEKILFPRLTSWSEHNNEKVKYYSGIANYKNTFVIVNPDFSTPFYLTIDSIHNIASVYINGIDCGTLWTPPYQLDISKAIKTGDNTIEIKVSNTWANRLIGDMALPEEKRVTWTTAPLNLLQGKPLLKAGLEGEIKIWQ